MNKIENTFKNSLGQTYEPFKTADLESLEIERVAPKVKTMPTTGSKRVDDIQEVIKRTGLKDGMTISFHHHLREGDYVFNQVMTEIKNMGFKDLTLAPSSLTNVMNDMVVECVKAGVITSITSSGMRGSLGEFVSSGQMENPVILRSHGNRARAIECGEIKIDVAFLAVPCSDDYGNANAVNGKAVFGSLGYARVDAQYADKVVLITDTICGYPNTPISIPQTQVDFVVKVEEIGNPDKIGAGATRFTKDPKELKIAEMVNNVIVNSEYFKDGFSFQTGTGGAALAVTRYLRNSMIENNVRASFALGGITRPTVDLLEEGLIDTIVDVQDFDKGAALGMAENAKQQEIDASFYAGPHNKGAVVNKLDVVILSALEIDTNFNVNVMTGSDGVLRGAIGGHQDAANAKLTIISAPLVRGRLATIVNELTTVVTPGESIDVVVTEIGIAINPARTDLIEQFKNNPSIPVFTMAELQERAEKIVGVPEPIEYTDKVVAYVEYRDGSLIDVVKQVKE
ncbi:citrate lyase subunit alpha [Vagococcus sp. PNs007]|uniref:Citrate lyase alpha chain n=1 Tax=Vagococcus proximus TaxID=2991417 RepID=A0ABT5WZ68_9ENTE|nr:citrate lyase subunit alpha [Vagococcus proximus]MDF0479058.1 citrate lyase subunit alpha [Vagococcus proximus]